MRLMCRLQLVMLVTFSSGKTVFRMRAETPYGSSAANWPSKYSSSGLAGEASQALNALELERFVPWHRQA